MDSKKTADHSHMFAGDLRKKQNKNNTEAASGKVGSSNEIIDLDELL